MKIASILLLLVFFVFGCAESKETRQSKTDSKYTQIDKSIGNTVESTMKTREGVGVPHTMQWINEGIKKGNSGIEWDKY